jgi:hypothetical protein
MTRLFLRLSSPRRIIAVAFIANLVHPLIHGTPLDGGALDACLNAATCAALTQGAK